MINRTSIQISSTSAFNKVNNPNFSLRVVDSMTDRDSFRGHPTLENFEAFEYLLPFGIDIRRVSEIDQPHIEYFRDQILLIEDVLCKNKFSRLISSHIRLWIGEILRNTQLTPSYKMAEWGSFYAFLTLEDYKNEMELFFEKITKPYKTPPSFFEIYQVKIFQKWFFLKNIHQEHCPLDIQKTFPSGKVHAFLLMCCETILPLDGKLNRGGIEAILICLNSRIGVFLRDEHRAQICHVLQAILTQVQFSELILKKAICSRTLENYVYYDLKIPFERSLTSLDLKRAALLALFFDLRQVTGEGNCYAVSALQDAIFHYPFRIFEQLLIYLDQGTISINQAEISLSFLLQFQEEGEISDFPFSMHQLSQLNVPFNICESYLETSSSAKLAKELSNELTINQFFEKYLSYSPFNDEKDLKSLRDIFISYHKNWLQQILISAMEFQECNSTPKIEGIFNQFDYKFLEIKCGLKARALFFFFFFKHLRKNLQYYLEGSSSEITRFFLERLLEKWFNHFFIVSVFERNIKISESKIETKYINWHLENPNNYISNFCASKYLFIYYENGDQHLITCYDTFIDYIKKMVYEVKKTLPPIITGRVINFYCYLETCFEKKHLKEILLESLTKINFSKECKITKSELAELEIPAFYFSGGNPQSALEVGLNLKATTSQVNSVSSEQFFKDLCAQISEIFKSSKFSSFDQKPLLFSLMTSKLRHSFLTYPQKYQEFWLELPFDQAYQQLIKDPANQLLTNVVTLDKKKRILHLMELDDNNEISQQIVSFQNESWRSFRCRILSYLNIDQLLLFNDVFNKIQSEFKLDIFMSIYLKKLLSTLYPFNKHISFNEIKDEIYFAADEQYFNPVSFAYLFQKVCTNNKLDLCDAFKIEKEICKLLKLPIPINVGDLNYEDVFGEKPIHKELILEYDLFSEKLIFIDRTKKVSEKFAHLLDANEFEFYLYPHPHSHP